MSTTPLHVGILDERGLHVPGGRIMPVTTPIADVHDLYQRAARLGLAQLWITAGGLRTLGLPAELEGERVAHPFIADPSDDLRIWPKRTLAGWLALEPRGRSALDIACPPYDQHAVQTWGRDTDAATLLAAIRAYAAAVGHPFRSSAGRTGLALVGETAGRTMRRDPVQEWPAPALNANTVREMVWLPGLTAEARQRRYLHAFDKNAMYLAACSSVELGLGDLTELAGAEDRPIAFDKKLPGYWYRRIGADPPGWHCTPTVTRAIERGDVQPITHAHVWRRHGRALEHWYERLRDARAALVADAAPASALALRTVKFTYAQTVSRFNDQWLRNKPESTDFRPDWRHMIVSLAAANLSRSMERMNAGGAKIVGVYVDCVYIVSDEADPVSAAGDAIRLGTAPGDFKVESAAIPLDRAAGAFGQRRPAEGWKLLREVIAAVKAERSASCRH